MNNNGNKDMTIINYNCTLPFIKIGPPNRYFYYGSNDYYTISIYDPCDGRQFRGDNRSLCEMFRSKLVMNYIAVRSQNIVIN